MEKPKHGWSTPCAWLLWKMEGWTAHQIKIAFQILAQQIASGMIVKLWHDTMCKDGYYAGPFDREETGEPDEGI